MLICNSLYAILIKNSKYLYNYQQIYKLITLGYFLSFSTETKQKKKNLLKYPKKPMKKVTCTFF